LSIDWFGDWLDDWLGCAFVDDRGDVSGDGPRMTRLGDALISLISHSVDDDSSTKSVGKRFELLHPSRFLQRSPSAFPVGMMENPLLPPSLYTYFISQDSKPSERSFTERDVQSRLYESLELERRVEEGLTM